MATTDRRFRAGRFLLATLAAPASSFLIWAAWDMTVNGAGPLDAVSRLFGGFLFAVLVTAWGVIPAAVFGALVLLPLLRLWTGPIPLAVLISAGLAAAGLYVSAALLMIDLPGAIAFAPWIIGRLDPETSLSHPLTPIAIAIVLSGAVGGLVYGWTPKVRARPWPAPRSAARLREPNVSASRRRRPGI